MSKVTPASMGETAPLPQGGRAPIAQRTAPERWLHDRVRTVLGIGSICLIAALLAMRLAASPLSLETALRHTLFVPLLLAGLLQVALGGRALLTRALARASLAIVLVGLINAMLLTYLPAKASLGVLWLASALAGALALFAADIVVSPALERGRLRHLGEGLLATLWFLALACVLHILSGGGGDEPIDVALPFFASAAIAAGVVVGEAGLRLIWQRPARVRVAAPSQSADAGTRTAPDAAEPHEASRRAKRRARGRNKAHA